MNKEKLIQEAIEITEYKADDDFDTRSGYIVASIKTYTWIDTDDLIEIIKSDQQLEKYRDELIQEFTEDRLNRIASFYSETEIDYYRSRLEGRVHVCTTKELERQIYKWKKHNNIERPDEVTPLKYFFKDWMKEADCNTVMEAFKKQYKYDIEENNRLDLFTPEVYQHGRSGGWLSVCKTDELEHDECDLLYNAPEDLTDSDMENIVSFIEDWKTKKEAIEYYVKEIEDLTENFEDNLKEEISFRLQEHIESINNIGYVSTLTVRANKCTIDNRYPVNTEDVKRVFRLVHDYKGMLCNGASLPVNIRIDNNYKIDRFIFKGSELYIKVGCQTLKYSQIAEALRNENNKTGE